MLPFEAGLLRHIGDEFPEIFEEMEEKGVLSDELSATLTKVIENFKTTFKSEAA